MSWANNGPAGPPQGPQNPHPGPQGPQQPRWAWWVAGIVIPVVGILVTILMSNSGSSDDESAEQETTPTRSSAPAGSAGGQEQPAAPPAESAAAAEVRYGPVTFDVDLTAGGARYVDLDMTAPVVMTADAESKDLTVSTSQPAPVLYTPDSANTLAVLPASGSTPTEAQCAEAVADGGTHTGEAARGSSLCLTTNKGRTAHLSVVSAPNGRGTVKFKVTVWETPAA